MLSWPSSHRIRYRGDGSPRTTSSTTPERGRRSVDSDSATTRLPTSKAMLTPSELVLAEHPLTHLQVQSDLRVHTGMRVFALVGCHRSDAGPAGSTMPRRVKLGRP